jgi:protein-L-isoaspartate(D-aspartate) O-methyltransferase
VFGLRVLNIGVAATALLALVSGPDPTYASTKLARSHAAMVADIRKSAQQDYPGLPDEPLFKAVIDAIAHIDRTRFVSADQEPYANRGTSLPIGFDQTISAPYVVALMTAAVGARAGSNVFEVGTGSGYQAAVLSRLGASVHSVEIVPQLADAAAKRLRRLRFGHVWIKAGDGFAGWREFAPYDAIIVTAGAAEVPAPLLDQLRPGGKLVMPIGANTFVEQLIVFTKEIDESFSRCSLGPFMFVPLTGVGGKPEVPGLYDRSVPLCRNGQTARWPGQAVSGRTTDRRSIKNDCPDRAP